MAGDAKTSGRESDAVYGSNQRSATAALIVALLAGVAVVVLLFPASGIDRQPPECYSMFGYVVPCGAWVGWVAGAVAAGVLGLVIAVLARRR